MKVSGFSEPENRAERRAEKGRAGSGEEVGAGDGEAESRRTSALSSSIRADKSAAVVPSSSGIVDVDDAGKGSCDRKSRVDCCRRVVIQRPKAMIVCCS